VAWEAVWRVAKASAERAGASTKVAAPVGAGSMAVVSSCRATSSTAAAVDQMVVRATARIMGSRSTASEVNAMASSGVG
jgi:hypothetical protein